jgi:hypothetical protein
MNRSDHRSKLFQQLQMLECFTYRGPCKFLELRGDKVFCNFGGIVRSLTDVEPCPSTEEFNLAVSA